MDSEPIGAVRPVNIDVEMRGSYLDYAMSVIVARALPDARDGMKPVHRRILFAMYDMGIRANTAYKKSARIVGEVLGKYHPHGDSSVYDALARMVQTFSLRYPLIDGQGNFGSVDGDSPAAMRYTEARMARVSDEMMTDIDMDTVDFSDNYDGTQQEPNVLPARLPNLLLNGSSGIAVGMATNIPPHNLRELTAAIVYLIDHYDTIDEVTVDELMQFVTAPDFPTGAVVIANDELKEAYATGRGRVVIQAKMHTEETRTGRFRIVVTEIPYQVSKTAIIERIIMLVREGRLPHVLDLRDESDRDGMRLVLELKQGAQAKVVQKALLKYSQLQSTYGIQMLALVNGEPRTLSLKRALHIYILHRYEVIVRRSEFELKRRQARAHILEGLLKALSSLDAIIQTIRQADDTEMARNSLVERFALTETQAEAILELQLRRLAALERLKLENEYNDVQARINYLETLLASPSLILGVIRADIAEMGEKYGDERRTEVDYISSSNIDEADLYLDEEIVISLTSDQYIKRVPSSAYRAQRRGGRGSRGIKITRENDVLAEIVTANSRDTVLFFTDKGKVYSERAYNINEADRAGRGQHIMNTLTTQADEKVTAIVPVSSFARESGAFVMATRRGRIKRVDISQFEGVRPSGLIAMSLEDGDTLNWVKLTDGNQDIILATSAGQSIRFHERGARVMGRQAGGVNSIALTDGDFVTGMDVVKPGDTHVLVVTRNALGKRTPLEEYRLQGRYGAGIKTLDRTAKTGDVIAVRSINAKDDILLITRTGIVLRTNLEAIRETGRSAQGVKLMNLDDGDVLVAMAIMAGEAIEEGDEIDESVDVSLNGAGDHSAPDGAANGATA